MPATILDGNQIAAEIKSEVAEEIARLGKRGVRPGLAAVLVGNDSASEIYIRNKVKTCQQLGIFSEKITPSPEISTRGMLDLVAQLNARPDIDGILIQLPLPKQIDAKQVLLTVAPDKDVDGFHPMNVGYLSTQRPGLVPCTPLGCMEILRRSGIVTEGAAAVVLGRSDIVGKPMAMLLTNANATVTLCHSKTRNLEEACCSADILVAAIGHAGVVTKEFVKPGATVIDVGINRITDRSEFANFFHDDPAREKIFQEKGSVLVGDVHPSVVEIAGRLTPVPGGVGPLTIAMLVSNTVKAAKMRRRIES